MDNNFSIEQVIEQAKRFVAGLTMKQRGLLVAGAVLVAATLYVFVELIGKPEYKTLYSGMSPADAQEITASLAAKKIPFEQSPDGASILVPADKLDSARLELASQPMPRSGRLGFELFDKPNWAGSDFSEKVNYQRALEAELERTLATLSEVEAVRVHLVMPAEFAVQRARPAGQSLGDGEAAPRQPAAAGRHGHPPAGGGRGRSAQRGECRGRRCRYQYAAQPLWRRRRWGFGRCPGDRSGAGQARGRDLGAGGGRRRRSRQRACGVRPQLRRGDAGDLRRRQRRPAQHDA